MMIMTFGDNSVLLLGDALVSCLKTVPAVLACF